MANDVPPQVEKPPDFKAQGEQLGLGLTEPAVQNRLTKGLLSMLQQLVAWSVEYSLKILGHIVLWLAQQLERGESRNDPLFRKLATTAIKDLMGVDADRGRATLGKQVMSAMTGGLGGAADGPVQPSTAAAEAYVEMVANLTFEGYVEGVIFEALSAGFLKKFGELDDALERMLGIGRTTRAVLRPILNARVVTPTQWAMNKTYRPSLLSPSEAARQIARGRGSKETWFEELRRQGYREDQIEAILNGQRKFLSPSEVRQFVERREWGRQEGLSYLKDAGYDPDDANLALRVGGLNRIEQHENQMAAAILGAYVNRDIDAGTFHSLMRENVLVDSERNLLTAIGEVRRAVNMRRPSLQQVEAMVRAGILAFPDYRAAARREGYDEGDVTNLELLLRYELQREKNLEEARRAAAEERASEKAARDAERATRRAEIEAERALAKRGAESDLERAAVRGLIPFSRLEEVYAARYDADTVAILLDVLEEDRQQYIAQQEARAAALQRGARRNISAGDVEQAFMTNILTADELRRRLESLGFDAADAQLLTATAVARKAEMDAAKAARAEAATRAAKRSIDLARFEQLVRRGARSLAQYDELLASLDFNEAARAAILELLQLKLADDAAAREERAAGEARLQTRGLSLEQFRRGVLLGVKTVEQFERFLLEQGFTTDAQIVLLADLRDDLAQAEAARAQREAAPAAVDARELSLAVVARAARLGVVSPDAYVDRLRRAGYAEDDVDIQLELLLLEIADIQAARARRDAVEVVAQQRGLSLAEMERAVKAGIRRLEDYRARAAELGYGADATDDLVALLELELAQLTDARTRRTQIAGELAARNLSLAQLEEAVTKGFKTLDEFVANVEALGYGSDDAELLAALLAVDLEAKATTP